MNERRLQFFVGLFVICAFVAVTVMVFQFGDMRPFWEHPYAIQIRFEAASGVHSGTSILKNGIRIGEVREVQLDEDSGGVVVLAEIDEQYALRADARPQLNHSLLGDATIEFIPGSTGQLISDGARFDGLPPTDPMEVVHRLETRLNATVEAFVDTSREWQRVGQNLNSLMDTNRGNLATVVSRTATALDEFTTTMRTANTTLGTVNGVLADPEYRKNLTATLNALPQLVEETRQTIAVVRSTVAQVDKNLETLDAATQPFAKSSQSLVTRLDSTLKNLDSVAREMNAFSKSLQAKDGSLQRFISDPNLYRNLNRSAESLAILLRNTEPILRDLRIFSDKVARHPELIGVSGAIKGSSGVKEPMPAGAPRAATAPGSTRRGGLLRN